MTDFDRFTEFLLREAAGYNEPPETPAAAMWPGVEIRVGLGADRSGRKGRSAAAVAVGETVLEADVPRSRRPIGASVDYNRPPPPPREEMWTRIESAWALRRAAPVSRLRPAWLGQQGATGWVAALAVAASLVLGIGLGRGTRPSQAGDAVVEPAVVETAPQRAAESAAIAEQVPEETDNQVAAGLAAEVAAVAEAARSAPAPSGDEVATLPLLTASSPAERPTYAARALEPDFDYATARHMGHAATLLTAFRTDRRTPASQEDLAGWARDLLAETRMYIGLSDSASPIEQELLQDLELVLIQISGLGPGAPDFEWDLARESMERQGTLTRLRAASAESET